MTNLLRISGFKRLTPKHIFYVHSHRISFYGPRYFTSMCYSPNSLSVSTKNYNYYMYSLPNSFNFARRTPVILSCSGNQAYIRFYSFSATCVTQHITIDDLQGKCLKPFEPLRTAEVGLLDMRKNITERILTKCSHEDICDENLRPGKTEQEIEWFPALEHWHSNDSVAKILNVATNLVHKTPPPLKRDFRVNLGKRFQNTTWSLSYDHENQTITTKRSMISSKTRILTEMNPYQAATYIARSVNSKLGKGYEFKGRGHRAPKWVTQYTVKTNILVDWVESSGDGELHILLVKRLKGRIMQYYLSVCGGHMQRSWGFVNGRIKDKETSYIGFEKAGRTANQQAKLQALNFIKKKIWVSGYQFFSSCFLTQDIGNMHAYTGDQYLPNNAVAQSGNDLEPPPPLMLAKKLNMGQYIQKNVSIAIQPKYDGLRCIADVKTGRLWSRSRKQIGSLDHISAAFRQAESLKRSVKGEFRWLDGELYVHGKSIQWINSVIRNSGSSLDERERIKFYTFDTILNEPFETRWQKVHKWYKGLSRKPKQSILLTETTKGSMDKLQNMYNRYMLNGMEGAMIRILDDTGYEIGKRSTSLQKMKQFRREEFMCVGVQSLRYAVPGDPILAGAMLLRASNGKRFKGALKGSVEEKLIIWQTREMYECSRFYAIVQFYDLSSDGIPRFPIVIGFRHNEDT